MRSRRPRTYDCRTARLPQHAPASSTCPPPQHASPPHHSRRSKSTGSIEHAPPQHALSLQHVPRRKRPHTQVPFSPKPVGVPPSPSVPIRPFSRPFSRPFPVSFPQRSSIAHRQHQLRLLIVHVAVCCFLAARAGLRLIWAARGSAAPHVHAPLKVVRSHDSQTPRSRKPPPHRTTHTHTYTRHPP